MSAIVQCHPHQTPLQPGACLDSAACSNPNRREEVNTAGLPRRPEKPTLSAHIRNLVRVSVIRRRESPAKIRPMIGLATHAAMPIRKDTDTSWAHSAKETAAPFQQSVSSPPKPVTFASPTRPEPFTHKGFLEMSVWPVKNRLQAVQLRCRSAVGGLLTGQMTSC